MHDPFRLVLGTHNQKKRAELARLLAPCHFQIAALSDFENVDEADETGSTFAENAEIKASFYAVELEEWVLAEDSGLSVAALDGDPGVFSARFSGENATDERNNQLLQKLIQEIPMTNRRAWYTCHICLADPDGEIATRAEAKCYGRIIDEPRGEMGFGYDPFFEIPEYDMTFAELGDSVKSVLSHRGRAYRKILPSLVAVARSNIK